ncbi:hypothetical protein P8452_20951 [Trifolium repens]|nr:hypothetical protein P8452_20951 [Trifolium repens]
MMLGKRPRPPMKRTTSLSEITFDLNTVITAEDDPNNNNNNNLHGPAGVGPFGLYPPTSPGINGSDQTRVLSSVSPRNHRRNSSDMTHPDFLRSCFLCKRRLVPGRDIYMYKGDSAFCSLECRQQQMNQDERKDKCCVVSSKKKLVVATGSQVATNL